MKGLFIFLTVLIIGAAAGLGFQTAFGDRCDPAQYRIAEMSNGKYRIEMRVGRIMWRPLFTEHATLDNARESVAYLNAVDCREKPTVKRIVK